MNPIFSNINLIVIGVSAGGLKTLTEFFRRLKTGYPPIVIVQHIASDADNYLVTHLNKISQLSFFEAKDKTELKKDSVYIAPPNYHTLIEDNFTISLSTEKKVNYSRPSINLLFETAANSATNNLLAIILTGANNDGYYGAIRVKELGGIIIAQNPKTAEVPTMPYAVIKANLADYILDIKDIASIITRRI